MFFSDNTDETRTYAANIKYDHMPEHLYKYRTFSNPNHWSALQQGVLYAAALNALNDIRESNLVISGEAEQQFNQTVYNSIQAKYGLPPARINNPSDIYRTAEKHFRRIACSRGIEKQMSEELHKIIITDAQNEYNQMMDAYRQSIRSTYSACCFSQSNNIFKMWGYYADCYNGFCIEYDFKSLGRDHIQTALLFPVIYLKDNRVFVDNIDLIDGNVNLFAATIKTQADWEYEEEWRLVFPEKEGGKPQTMPEPTAIYIGDRTDTENTDKMKTFCIGKGIPLYRMKYNQKKDILEPHRLL